jgi:hypothetical protein
VVGARVAVHAILGIRSGLDRVGDRRRPRAIIRGLVARIAPRLVQMRCTRRAVRPLLVAEGTARLLPAPVRDQRRKRSAGGCGMARGAPGPLVVITGRRARAPDVALDAIGVVGRARRMGDTRMAPDGSGEQRRGEGSKPETWSCTNQRGRARLLRDRRVDLGLCRFGFVFVLNGVPPSQAAFSGTSTRETALPLTARRSPELTSACTCCPSTFRHDSRFR